ncbi:MAG: hypothetical protein ACREAC_30525, partial [Blastocatellia bacterium]
MALVFFHLLDLEVLSAKSIGQNQHEIGEAAIRELKLLYLACGLSDTIVIPPGCLLESELARTVVFEARDILETGELALIYSELDLASYRDARIYTYRNVIHIPQYRDAYRDRRGFAQVATIPRRVGKPSVVDRTLTRGLRERIEEGGRVDTNRSSNVYQLVLRLEEMDDQATVWAAVEQLERMSGLSVSPAERGTLRDLLFNEYVLAYARLGLTLVESTEFSSPQFENIHFLARPGSQ